MTSNPPARALPELYMFAISHYCEKARWALDRAGIEYSLQYLAPGFHRRFAKKLGLPASSLPILKIGDTTVQGSSAIIDWAEEHGRAGVPTLRPDGDTTTSANSVERRLDDVLGVHVRRYYYSEALVEYPQTVKPVFTNDLSGGQKLLLELSWGVIRKIMIDRMDLGSLQGIESRQILELEFDWLDSLLSKGRPFLVGDRFSRVDITAASLLAPLIKPGKHPTYNMIELPPNVSLDCENWSKRPCLQWASNIYQEYR
ncbi:MAG: glutathione S-transferase [Gammaproteobacteria bacterium]|nr:glutathione S-transferase [Gammaproteobacteria bacterium]